jgi:hypothetical protein
MIDYDDSVYFSNIRLDHKIQKKFWSNVREKSSDGGKFYIDIAKKLSYVRFVPRDGEWSLPWNQELIPGFEMPDYEPNFSKSFAQVTDERANYIKARINNGDKFAVMYSGGMDSTLILSSLLKNLSKEELQSIMVCCSIHSIIENPEFWRKHIYGKLKIIDSSNHSYDDYIGMGYRPITGDEGDCIFGTSIGLQLYHNYDFYVSQLDPAVQSNLLKLRNKISSGDVHYTLFADIISRHLSYNTTAEGLEFGRLLYEKYHRNIITSKVPVHSLHDFFWWLIFNVKYLNCSVRGAIYFNHTLPIRQCIDSMENWFNGEGYQKWSMVNNNNGSKIRNTLATYKYDQRKYIYDFDKNDWYFQYKTKLESLTNLLIKGKIKSTDKNPAGPFTIAIDKNYLPLNINDINDPSIKKYFLNHFRNYEIDWINR